MSVKVAPLSEAIAAPGPVAPVALSQRVEARHRHGGNDDARHHAAAPPAEHIPEEGGDACYTAWADRRAGLREQATPEMVLVVAQPGIAPDLALLPSAGVVSGQVASQSLATPAAPAQPGKDKPGAPGGTMASRPPHTAIALAPAKLVGNITPATPGNGKVPAAVSPLPLASTALPAVATASSAEHQHAPPSPPTTPADAAAAATATTPGVTRVVVERIQSMLSLRGLPDLAAAPAPSSATPATPATPAAPTFEPGLAAMGDVATPQPTTLVVAAAPAAADTPAQPQAGGESLLTAARAEANVTTRKIVHAAQQATMLQATMAARTQPASQVNVAFRSWGVDASGSAHSVRVRLQDGQAIVQPSTARVGQALASADLPFGVDLQPAVEQVSTATDERRRRRGQQPSP